MHFFSFILIYLCLLLTVHLSLCLYIHSTHSKILYVFSPLQPATNIPLRQKPITKVLRINISTEDSSYRTTHTNNTKTITNNNIQCCRLNTVSRLKLGNACYHSVQKLLSSRLLSKNLKIKIYRTIILSVVLYGCETWSLTLREEHRLRVFENRVLRRIFGPNRGVEKIT